MPERAIETLPQLWNCYQVSFRTKKLLNCKEIMVCPGRDFNLIYLYLSIFLRRKEMKKNLVLVLLLILAMMTNSLLSQPVQYTSKEMNGCTPTGYTNVITLLWINSDTVQVSKSQRISTGNDSTCSYDLAGLDYTENGNTITFQCEEDIWVIPFEGDLYLSKCVDFGNFSLTCDCEGEGSCDILVNFDDNGDLHATCDHSPCTECCNPDVSTGPCSSCNSFLILRAKSVIY